MTEGEDIDFDPLGEKLPDEEDPDDINYDESSELLKKDKKIGELTKTKTKKKFDPYGGKVRSKEEEIPLIETKTDKLKQELREEIRGEVEKYYPKMSPSVEIIQNENGLSARLYSGKNEKWTALFTKKGKLAKKMTNELKRALGPTAEEIIDKNEEENSKDREEIKRIKELGRAKEEKDRERIGELREEAKRTDISDEVRETTTNQANVIEERIEERKQERETTTNVIEEIIGEREKENERIKERMPLPERIKKIFKEHGLTAFSILTSVGTIISVIVSKLTSGTAKVANFAANGLKKIGKNVAKGFKEAGKQIAKILPGIGKQLAQILPKMIGAIVNFLFKTAGEALGFLGKNSWLLILFIVTYGVEQFTRGRRLPKKK